MAYLDHKCRLCGHQKLTHKRNFCSWGWCKANCTSSMAVYGPPEVVPTFTRDGQPIETLTAPGEVVYYDIRACGCADCVGAFRVASAPMT